MWQQKKAELKNDSAARPCWPQKKAKLHAYRQLGCV